MDERASFNNNHPETYSAEKFIGNAGKEDYSEFKWKTKRKGDQAYDKFGYKIPRATGIRPVFISKVEYYQGVF
ncbi:MAG: hypothetical protein Q8O88_05445 [bacterium]|nr:hypothetical protein [bacterium]